MPDPLRPGTDVVSVRRIARLMTARGGAFLARWFSPDEIQYCERKARPERHFAARIAGKESVVKALGMKWNGPIRWRCIEILHDSDGIPRVRLTGPALEFSRETGVASIEVSLSHCDEYATAVAFAVPGARTQPPGNSGMSAAN